jgi:hypothetical protein
MSAGSTSDSAGFVDLSSFSHVDTSVTSAKSSVIKSPLVRNNGVAKIEVLDGNKTEPTIHVHRQNDKITKIEFICSCGKSTDVDLEYEDE